MNERMIFTNESLMTKDEVELMKEVSSLFPDIRIEEIEEIHRHIDDDNYHGYIVSVSILRDHYIHNHTDRVFIKGFELFAK